MGNDLLSNVMVTDYKTSAPMLKNVEGSKRQKQPQPYPEIIYDDKSKPDDDETYLKALQLHGAMSYGVAMRVLKWGGTRAGQTETRLFASGRIAYNRQGSGMIGIGGNLKD